MCADSDPTALKAMPTKLLVLARAGAAAFDAAALRLLVRDTQVVAATVLTVPSHAVVLADPGAAAIDAAAPIYIYITYIYIHIYMYTNI